MNPFPLEKPVPPKDEAKLLLMETSGSQGWAGIALGQKILFQKKLEEGRKHVRDLGPSLLDLTRLAGWKFSELDAIASGIGPGSYTGLRVGVMTARTLAIATGARLFGISTFTILANSCPSNPNGKLEIIADAQKDKLYRQLFGWKDSWRPASSLEVISIPHWLEKRNKGIPLAGPGIVKVQPYLSQEIPWEKAEIRLEVVANLALDKLFCDSPDNPMTLQPLYLRRSSAEEQWEALGKTTLKDEK